MPNTFRYIIFQVNELTKRLLDADEMIAKQKAEISDILKRFPFYMLLFV